MENPILLTKAALRKKLKIVQLLGGPEATARLLEMGLVRGTHLKVIKNDAFGPLILAIGHNRLAIGRGLAEKIQVIETHE